MLRAENIQYAVGKKQILNGITADFCPGEINMILGPNGSGKSSFLKIFAGETEKYSGNIFYNEKNIAQQKKESLATYRAVMSQQPELSFPLMVKEVVMMGRYPHFDFNPTKKDGLICDEVLEKLNLNYFKDRNYLTLSGGEKQRVQFARVLAQIWEPPANGQRFLFLDEPLNSLDINYQQEFLKILQTFTKPDTTVIAVMHDLNLAIQFADKLFFLKSGELVRSGEPTDIISEDLLQEVFAVKTSIIKNPITNNPLVIYI